MADIQKYKNDFNKNNYKTYSFRIPKEKQKVMETLSVTHNKSINYLIVNAIEKQYHVDLSIVESKLKGDE